MVLKSTSPVGLLAPMRLVVDASIRVAEALRARVMADNEQAGDD
jgi:hypothetical protein